MSKVNRESGSLSSRDIDTSIQAILDDLEGNHLFQTYANLKFYRKAKLSYAPYLPLADSYSLIAGITSCPSRSMHRVAVSWDMGPSRPHSTM